MDSTSNSARSKMLCYPSVMLLKIAQGVKGSHQSECGQAVLRQHRNRLRCCLQLPLTWQYHPKSQSPAEQGRTNSPERISPSISLLSRGALTFPFRRRFGCSVRACHLLLVRPQLYYWFECKKWSKRLQLMKSLSFLHAWCLCSIFFYLPVIFRCQLLGLISVFIFTRIQVLISGVVHKTEGGAFEERDGMFPILNCHERSPHGSTALLS